MAETYEITVPILKGNDGKWKKIPSLNEYILAERTTIRKMGNRLLTKGAVMKKTWQEYMSIYIRKSVGRLKIEKPIIIRYQYYMPDQKMDVGNIHSTTQKFFEDALQDCGTIINDNQKYIKGFTADFFVDKDNPHITVVLEIVEEG